MDSTGDQHKKKVAFKYKYKELFRKRLFLLASLTLNDAVKEVENLFVIQLGKYRLYLDEDFKSELTEECIVNLRKLDPSSLMTVKVYIKETVFEEPSLEVFVEKNLVQNQQTVLLKELMTQELVKRHISKQLSFENLARIKGLKLEDLASDEVRLLSDAILKLLE